MAEPAVGDVLAWRTIDELAGLVGAYCWVEHRLFEVTGAWASAPEAGGASADAADGELRVWCAATAQRHGAIAGRWAGRLPVRAGVDPASLVAAPLGLARALDDVGATKELAAGVGALVETVLPWLDGVYASHLVVASPVSEASVMEVLLEARQGGQVEIRSGRTLLERLEGAGIPVRHLGTTLERAFADRVVLPAVRPA
ncbi:MAG TPA: hypothetical protein VIY26_14895 [Acidimicrobiales bacterium]